MPEDESLPLSALRPGRVAVVLRVLARNLNLLRYLDSLGLTPGAQIEVIDYSPFDNNLTIQVEGKAHGLGLSITTKIFVQFDG